MLDRVILQLLESCLGNDSRTHGIVTHGNRASRDIGKALWAVHISILIAVVRRIAGNGAEWLAIAVEHLWTEGILIEIDRRGRRR